MLLSLPREAYSSWKGGAPVGCDIHAAIEVREYNEWWTFVAQPSVRRNYELFSLLAGVRGEHEPWIPPRGLPDRRTISYDAWHEGNGNYGEGVVDGDHSASWFTLEEAQRFRLPECNDSTRTQWNMWLHTMNFFAKLYNVSADRVRVIFNFDN